jgi:hypothetical protein
MYERAGLAYSLPQKTQVVERHVADEAELQDEERAIYAWIDPIHHFYERRTFPGSCTCACV